jgi:hypothetical protein
MRELRAVIPLYLSIDFSQMFLPLVLPFIAARFSAMAFFGGIFVFAMGAAWVWPHTMSRAGRSAGQILYEEAVRAVARTESEKREHGGVDEQGNGVRALSARSAPSASASA